MRQQPLRDRGVHVRRVAAVDQHHDNRTRRPVVVLAVHRDVLRVILLCDRPGDRRQRRRQRDDRAPESDSVFRPGGGQRHGGVDATLGPRNAASKHIPSAIVAAYSSAKALTPVVTTTTNCLPFGAMYVIGVVWPSDSRRASQRTWPVRESKARKRLSIVPAMNTSPPAVAIGPPLP